jgi:hypothetical protein
MTGHRESVTTEQARDALLRGRPVELVEASGFEPHPDIPGVWKRP